MGRLLTSRTDYLPVRNLPGSSRGEGSEKTWFPIQLYLEVHGVKGQVVDLERRLSSCFLINIYLEVHRVKAQVVDLERKLALLRVTNLHGSSRGERAGC